MSVFTSGAEPTPTPTPIPPLTTQPTPTPTPTPTVTIYPYTVVYLSDFGVTGDGSDETSEIITGLNYARDYSISTVIFPSNVTVTSGTHFHIPGGITVIGNNATLKLKDNTNPSGTFGWVAMDKGSSITGLTFNGNYEGGNGHNTNGIQVTGGSVGHPQVFDNNTMYNFGTVMVGVYANDGVPTDIHITNNTLTTSYQYGIITGCTDGTYCYGHDLIVANNTISNCSQVGIKIRGTHDSIITNNTVNVGARTLVPLGDEPSGIRLYDWDEENNNVTISHNIVTGLDEDPSVCIDSDDSLNYVISILNNTISHCHEGIEIEFNNGNISYNTISNYSHCIVDDGTGNTKTENVCL
jgi:parallel beta-helix repeat protein